MEKKNNIKQDEKASHPQLNKWKGKVDSKGFRKLNEQVILINTVYNR